jgi:hypothetical protein
MAKRDAFTEATKRVIASRVGYRCARPDCQAETAGPTRDTSKSYNVGVAAHISAAAIGGPRYDASITPEQRRHPENGIWLCQTHAKEIDDDVHAYPVDLIKAWKKDAEQRAKSRLGRILNSNSGRPFFRVSDAERYGLQTQAILEDGRQIPMADPFDPSENKPTFYASPSYVVRFMIEKHADAGSVLVTGICATCYAWWELPKFSSAAYALPVRVNPYIVNLQAPVGGKPRPCVANLYFHEDQDHAMRFAPLVLESDTPSVIDVRFNAEKSGIYSFALDVLIACGVERQTRRVLDQTDVLFLEPFSPDAA